MASHIRKVLIMPFQKETPQDVETLAKLGLFFGHEVRFPFTIMERLYDAGYNLMLIRGDTQDVLFIDKGTFRPKTP